MVPWRRRKWRGALRRWRRARDCQEEEKVKGQGIGPPVGRPGRRRKGRKRGEVLGFGLAPVFFFFFYFSFFQELEREKEKREKQNRARFLFFPQNKK